MEIYTIRNLNFRYPGASENALSELSFSVQKGEFVTICGLSGCGKSTLLRQLKTCLQPVGDRTGEILYCSQALEKATEIDQSREIGFVQQSPDHQSITDKVWHELAFGLESLGYAHDIIQRRVSETAAFFGIEKWFEKPVAELSGGQKQILNIASAMITRPEVLILDEPTAQLDPIASYELINWLKRIHRELGTTIIMSEHNLEEILSVTDRLIVMSEGRIIADTNPRQACMILHEKKEPAFLSMPAAARIYRYCDASNEETPLSVVEGRNWLVNYTKTHQVYPLEEEQQDEKADTLLTVKNVWFRYDKETLDILKGCSLEIKKNEFLTIVGGNGSGKTTLLALITGIQKAYRGKIEPSKRTKSASRAGSVKMALLPQNPQTLFVAATVKEELYEVLSGGEGTSEQKNQDVQEVVRLCGLQKLLNRHPYDLSGGEQQKAALAKLLLTKPQLLLLDEPTKGLDCAFRRHLAEIIRYLTTNGTTVIAVSHDLDFCAENADRCAMLFNGRIVSTDSPRNFFASNGMYTTSAGRMANGLIAKAVTVQDILMSLKSAEDDATFYPNVPDPSIGEKRSEEKETITEKDRYPQKRSVVQTIFCGTMLLFTIITLFITMKKIYVPFFSEHQILDYTVLIISFILFVASAGKNRVSIAIVKSHGSIRRSVVAALTIFVLVPSTVLAGVYLLDDSKYLFISLLVLLESTIPFYLMFEKRKVQTRELVLTAVLCSMCVAGRAALYMFPECKPVTALVILSAIALGSESGFLIGSMSMLASNIIFGQGIWTPWQMLTMGLIGYITGLLFHHGVLTANKVIIAVYGFLAVFVLYGGIMNPATLILSRSAVNIPSLIAVYAAGLPLDTVHALTTAFFLYFGAEPMLKKLERIKRKYGLIR